MPLNLPDVWGVKKEWTNKKIIIDVNRFIVYPNNEMPEIAYVKRTDIPTSELGDLVKHKPISVSDKILTQSRLGDSAFDEMIEYWVLNPIAFNPDSDDKKHHQSIIEKLKRRGIECR